MLLKAFVKDLQLAGAAGVIALFAYLFSETTEDQQ